MRSFRVTDVPGPSSRVGRSPTMQSSSEGTGKLTLGEGLRELRLRRQLLPTPRP